MDNNTFPKETVNENTRLLFEYTKSWLSERCRDVDKVNTKLTTFLAFSGVALNFSVNLHGDIPQLPMSIDTIPLAIVFLSKILATLLSIYAIISCSSGIIGDRKGLIDFSKENSFKLSQNHTESIGKAITPRILKSNYFFCPTIEGQIGIINKWIDETIPEIEARVRKKQKYLVTAIDALTVTAIAFGVNIFTNSIFH